MASNVFFPFRQMENSSYDDLYREKGHVSTPQWIISAGEIFGGDNADSNYQKYSKCHSVETFLGHDIRSNAAGNFTSGGRIIAQDTSVVMPIGPYITDIKKAIGNATKIDTIITIRISVVEGTITPLQTTTFSNCYFTYLQQSNDNMEFHFRFNKADDEYAVIKQDGSISGSKTSSIDINQFKIGDAG